MWPRRKQPVAVYSPLPTYSDASPVSPSRHHHHLNHHHRNSSDLSSPVSPHSPLYPPQNFDFSPRKTFRNKLAFFLHSRLVLGTIIICAVFAFTLASTRFGQHLRTLVSGSVFGKVQQIPLSLSPSGGRPITTSGMAPPQYRRPPQAPPLFTATPESIIADTHRILARSKKVSDDIVKDFTSETATFDNTVLPLALDDNEASLETHIIGFYQSVSTDKKLRDASSDAEKIMDDFGIEAAMREDVFGLVDAVLKKNEKLDPESRRLVEKDHKGYIRYGLGIPAGPQRDRFKEIKKRLSELSIAFQKTLNEEDGGLWLKPEDLEGVSQDLVADLKKGDGEHKGKVWLDFKYPSLFPTLKYALNSTVREQLFTANENKCNSNIDAFKETIVLRDEAARLLGYKNHAEFRIEDKMAKTPETVNEFLNDLRQKLAPGGLEEKKKLYELKKSDLESRGKQSEDDGNYYLWDHRFYDRLMLEKNFQLDQEKIAEYFPLQSSLRGMLQIFEELFGMVFVELVGEDRDALAPSGKGEDIAWHPDVQIFSVWDDEGEGSGFIGYLYLDLHPRPGKYGHAANFDLQPGFTDAQGKRRYPATALVCNFSKPTAKKPSLLKHDELVTLFHELGHGIHSLVSKTKYSRFHGTSTVRDFVEAPSQMLENWCWTPSQLRGLSKHYSYLSEEYAAEFASTSAGSEKVPEQMPDDLIDSIIRTKHVNDALFNLRQLHFGIFDMTVHQPATHEEVVNLDASVLYNQLRKDISKIDGPEVKSNAWDWGHGQATFGHLIGGYDAGYYGYLSSQVYSTDMFYSVFKKDPMNGKEGRRYRYAVLEKGGSQEEMKTLEDFLGRKPSSEAFYRELGL